MKILLIMMHQGYLRNYESVIKELAIQGHQIELFFNAASKSDDGILINDLLKFSDNIKYSSEVLGKRSDGLRPISLTLRAGIDYVRYFLPEYSEAKKLRERIESKKSAGIWKFPFKLVNALSGKAGLFKVRDFLQKLDAELPLFKPICSLYKDINPDLILITPLLNFASDQTDYVITANKLKIPVILCVASWDNLTNKGAIRGMPDKVIVWNELQKNEAAEFHSYPAENVIVTGAQCYDKWYNMKPSSERDSFCAKLGLKSDSPYVLYLCSSPFIAPQEVPFIKEWLAKLRNSDNLNLKNCPVIIRPHPQNAKQWQDETLAEYENVVIYPKLGANPITDDAKSNFYDSIYHSCCVVGVNTSAMIEAGILDKTVFTVLDARFAGTQQGTLHFKHLENGGLMYVATDLNQHAQQLSKLLSDNDESGDRRRDFVMKFIRPRGISNNATQIFCEEINKLQDLTAQCKNKELEAASLAVKSVKILITLTWKCLKQASTLKSLFNKVPKKANSLRKKLRSKARTIKGKISNISPNSKNISRLTKKLDSASNKLPIQLVANSRAITNHYQMYAFHENQKRLLTKIATSNKPIIVGPWLSEVGFELLYWIPYLRHIISEYNISPDRVIVASRGGVDNWYSDFSSKYFEIFSEFSQDQFRENNAERIEQIGSQKHMEICSFDEKIVALVKSRFELQDFDWIHPSLMYNLFKGYWTRKASVQWIEQSTKYANFSKPRLDIDKIKLPKDFVAIKFYFSEAFPDTPQNRSFINNFISQIIKDKPVVLLNTGFKVDDHDELSSAINNQVLNIDKHLTLTNNLAVQSYVVSRASAFYGTYGGFSYLAPFYGVPSIGFYSREDKFLPVHVDLANRAFRAIKYGKFDKIKNWTPPAANGPKTNFTAMSVDDFLSMPGMASFSSESHDFQEKLSNHAIAQVS